MPAIRDGAVQTHGPRLTYRECGDPDRPGVLILHGLMGNAWEWDPVAEALGERFHVVALNQRGHGDSDWAASYAPAAMAEDIAVVIETLQLERPAVVAHSMGGINAILFAAAHADRLSRLVIGDVGPGSLAGPAALAVREGLLASAAATYDGEDAALAEWLASTARPNEPLLRHYVRHNLRRTGGGRWAWRYDAQGLTGYIDGLPSTDELWEAVRAITCPTLILRAAESPILDAASAAQLADTLADGRWVEIPESGHDMHIEQTERVVAELRAFLT